MATLYYFFYMNFSLIRIKLNDGISNCFLQTSYNKVIIVAVLYEIPDTKQYVCNLQKHCHIFLVSFLRIQ